MASRTCTIIEPHRAGLSSAQSSQRRYDVRLAQPIGASGPSSERMIEPTMISVGGRAST